MKSVFCAGAGIQNILSEWRQPASRSSLCVGSFLFGRESGHSIARPIACGNRVPPQRTVLRETPDVSDCGFVPGIFSQFFKAEAGIKVHPFRGAEEKGLQALRREGVGQPDDKPPADAAPPQWLRSLAAGHVSLLRSNGISTHGTGKLPALFQSPDHSPAAGAL